MYNISIEYLVRNRNRSLATSQQQQNVGPQAFIQERPSGHSDDRNDDGDGGLGNCRLSVHTGTPLGLCISAFV